MTDIEVFRPIEDFEDRYEVSNLGRVRSLSFQHSGEPGILKPNPSPQPKGRKCGPYHRVRLQDAARGLNKMMRVHRLVAIAFCPGRSAERDEVNHIDGNTENNHASNLEWVTHSENQKHACLSGLASPPAPPVLGTGVVHRWTHSDGRSQVATVNDLARMHGLDKKSLWRLSRPDKYPHAKSIFGWRYAGSVEPGDPTTRAALDRLANAEHALMKGTAE